MAPHEDAYCITFASRVAFGIIITFWTFGLYQDCRCCFEHHENIGSYFLILGVMEHKLNIADGEKRGLRVLIAIKILGHFLPR